MTNHELPQPHDDEPERPVGPDRERLEPGEIDLTGVVHQPDDLIDVISDALVEARAAGGEVPEWGARAIARALANSLPDLVAPALHTFAAVGNIRESIGAELAVIYASPHCPPQMREWIDYLGTWLVNHETSDARPPDHQLQEPLPSGALDKVTVYLREIFDQADTVGEAIAEDDARAIATLLAPLLPSGSAMSQLADHGKVDASGLLAECELLKAGHYRTREITAEWIPRLEQHVLHPPKPPRFAGAVEPYTGRSAEGVREHGDAFRAFLMLDDVDPRRDDLISRFHEWYVATFSSRDALLDGLSEVTDWEAAVKALAEELGIEGFVRVDREAIWDVIHDAWEIVELNGKYYVFEK